MADAKKVVEGEVEQCEKEYKALLSEWQSLERTLRLLGIDRLDTTEPRTLSGLKEQISGFREQCAGKVGEEGMSLLAFLQGDSDFPAGLTIEAVRDALLSLRALIVISSKPGDQNA